jgi:hypothetical protein
MMRVAIDVVGPCVGPTWRQGGWPLFHNHGVSSLVSDATSDPEISYVGMDYRHDLDMMLPLGEYWDQRGMCLYYGFMFCDFYRYH